MEKLSNKDFTAILINVMYVKLLLAIPRNMINIAGNAAWLLSIFATLIMLLLFYILTKLHDFSSPVLNIKSTPWRLIIGIITTITLLLSMASVVKVYPETVKIILLKNTPIEIILIIAAIVASLSAHIGIEPLGRICSLFQPIAAVISVLCILFLIPHMEPTNLTPLLANGGGKIFINGLTAVSGFSDIFLLYILAHNTKEPKKLIKTGYKAIIIMGVIMTTVMLTYCLIFPSGISQTYLLPIYQMVRLVQIGDFFGRFEAFFEFIWSISILLYYSIYLYTLSVVWQKTFNLPYSKPLIAPFMAIISLIVYLSGPYVQLNKNYVWYASVLIAATGIIPLISTFIKKGEERMQNNENP